MKTDTIDGSRAWRPELPGWSDDILPWHHIISPSIPHGGKVAIVGVLFGRDLVHLAELRPDLQLWAIDPWECDMGGFNFGESEYGDIIKEHGGLWGAFIFHLLAVSPPEVLERIHIIRAPSERGLGALPLECDMIFLDGNHDAPYPRNDIALAESHVKPGGILAGHDYQADYPDVVAAVDALGQWHDIQHYESVWWAVCK